ncbi:MAG: hypothetical protein ABEJ77_03575 [Halanaeroarchaeum sp.]
MHQDDALADRLAAVERALTGEDAPVGALEDRAALDARIATVERRLEALDARLDETEAAITAVRGYVGEISHVNDEVERTAHAALAAVERLDGEHAPPALATVDPPEHPSSSTPSDPDARPEDDRQTGAAEVAGGPLRAVVDWLGDLA